jgi:hypothetical protein
VRAARGSVSLVVVGLALLGSLGGCSDDDGDPEAFCAGIGAIVDVEALVGGPPAEQDPATSLRNAADRMRELSGDAPDDIDGDVRKVADAVEILAEAAADPDVGVAGRLGELDRDALTESVTKIEAYARDECGITLRPSSPPSSAAPPG